MQDKDRSNLFKQSNLAITGTLLIVLVLLFVFNYFVFNSEISKAAEYVLGGDNYINKSIIPDYTSLTRDNLHSKQIITGQIQDIKENNSSIELTVLNTHGNEVRILINKNQDSYATMEYTCTQADCIELEKKFYYTSEFDLEIRNDFINLPEIDISDISINSDMYIEITNRIEEEGVQSTNYLIVSRKIDA